MTEIVGGFTAFSQRSAKVDGGVRGVRYAREDAVSEEREPHQFDPEKLKEIAETDRRWAWVEVDLGAIRRNISAIKQRIGRNKHVMAVVKGDAYGHGAVQVAKTALSSGADHIGVATVDEAIALREGLVNAPILVLSEPPIAAIPLLLAYKVMPSIYTLEFAIAYAEAADSYGLKAPYHLAINTGLNNIGVFHGDVVAFLSQVGFHRALELKGVFTHYATADSPDLIDFQKQATRFVNAVNAMHTAGFNPGIIHSANSAATLRYPEVQFDMVRIGLALYGFDSSPQVHGLAPLEPAFSVHARIVDVNAVAMGEGVGDRLSYRSPGSVKICTLPIGYGDGLPSSLSNRISVMYNGKLLRQVGDIGMDHCMFEIDLRSYPSHGRWDPQVGDEALLIGRQGDVAVTVDELAALAGMRQAELCMRLASRLPRVYV